MYMACVLMATGELLVGLLISVVGFLSFAAPCITSHCSLSPSHAEKTLATLYTLLCCSSMLFFWDGQDSVFCTRSLSIQFTLSKALLPMMGFRLATAAVVSGVIGVNEFILPWLITRRYAESNDILLRLPGHLLFYTSWYLVAVLHQQNRWRMLYDTQVTLAAEKAASNEMKAAMESSCPWYVTLYSGCQRMRPIVSPAAALSLMH